MQLVEKREPGHNQLFLTALIAAVPYKIHTILTDNEDIQFRVRRRATPPARLLAMTTMSAMRCRENDIEHRFTKINHPWTNGQVERMTNDQGRDRQTLPLRQS